MTSSITAQSPAEVDDKDTVKMLSFLCLPAEIRNKIYKYSLVEAPSAGRIEGLAQPPLTRTNRQIRSEALPIYYGNNRFKITIPSLQPLGRHDDWADFIRMFRVFKAGGTHGRGTGSLQYLRTLSCLQRCTDTRESFWELKVIFLQPAEPAAKAATKKKRRVCGPWESRYVHRPEKDHLLEDRDYVYNLVEMALGEHMAFVDAMHEACVQRLISTVVMVATECPGLINTVRFNSDVRWENDGSE